MEKKKIKQTKIKLVESVKPPKAAGNQAFRNHNNIQFLKTEKLKELNKKH